VKEILQQDAIAQAESIRNGDINAEELVEQSIAAIEGLNPKLNAVITPMYDRARAKLKDISMNAPFAGVPMLLKDGIACIKGERFTNGSRMLMQHKADYDSELVKRFEAAGFIILGKTNMPEFGLLPTTEPLAFGPTHNPWDLDKSPGGSSGGSAAAVAARMVAVAHGNDGGGSIRIPSSCCGLFGLKPSRGRNPLGPMGSLVSGLVEEHVLTRSVRDSAAILDITSAPDPLSFYHGPASTGSYLEILDKPLSKMRIGFSLTTPFGGPVHKDCEDATMKTVELLKSMGHQLEEMPLKIPFTGKELGDIFNTLWAVGATTALSFVEHKFGQAPPAELVEPLSMALYNQGKNIPATQYELVRLQTHRVARSVLEFFNDIDIWLSPTLAMPPVDLGVMAQDTESPLAPYIYASKFAPMTALFNVSGQPAASLPVHCNEEGLPIGVQVVSNLGDEASLLQLSHHVEKEVGWQGRVPGV